jgi:hypothetical protein
MTHLGNEEKENPGDHTGGRIRAESNARLEREVRRQLRAETEKGMDRPGASLFNVADGKSLFEV